MTLKTKFSLRFKEVIFGGANTKPRLLQFTVLAVLPLLITGCDKDYMNSLRQRIHSSFQGSKKNSSASDAKGSKRFRIKDDLDIEGILGEGENAKGDSQAKEGRHQNSTSDLDDTEDRLSKLNQKNSSSQSSSQQVNCPDQGKVNGEGPPKGLAEWCESSVDGQTVKHGPFKKWYKSGQIKFSGNYYLGKSHGTFTAYQPNGELAERRQFKNGFSNGIWTKWDKNGNKSIEGSFLNNKKNGLFTAWDRQGRLKYEGSFKNDLKNGIWTTYYAEGIPHTKNTWVEGKKNGKAETFYKTGNLMIQGAYKDDKANGTWTTFYKSGRIKSQGSYLFGQKNGTWVYYRNNSTVSRTTVYELGRTVQNPNSSRHSAGNQPHSTSRRQRQEDESSWKSM